MLLVAQMIGHLGLQRSLQDGFGQFLEQAVLPDDILGFLVVGQQLVDQLLVDSHGTFILLFFPQPFTQFYLYPRQDERQKTAPLTALHATWDLAATSEKNME